MHDESGGKADTRLMLEESGYRVYLVGSCDDAAECYSVAQDSGYPFSAVILDASVRDGTDERDAIKRLLDIDPDVKAIVVGDGKDPIVTNFKEYGFRGALAKPYSREELARTLSGALGSKGTI